MKIIDGRIRVDWEDLPLEHITKSIKNCAKRLKTNVGIDGGHIEHNM
jgi:hypothetical protein